MATSDLTPDRLRETLDYNSSTGVFTWRKKYTNSRISIGQIAGSRTSKGYWEIRVDRCSHKAHRLAWMYEYGEFPPEQIDHINGDRSDNRICNLRSATNAENQQNQSTTARNSKSGLIGVAKAYKGWCAKIVREGVAYHLGTFETKELAFLAYTEAKKRLHTFNPHLLRI